MTREPGNAGALAGRGLCVIAALALVSAPAAFGAPRAITLGEALQLGRQHSSASVRAQGTVRNGRAQVRSALGAFLPNLSLSASTARQYPSRGGGTVIQNGQVVTLPSTPWSYGAGLSSGVTLFAGGKRLFDLRQARASLDAAEASALASAYSVDLDVKSSYFDVLAARESEAAAEAQLAQAEQQRKTAIAKLRSEQATKSDSLRADIQLGNAQLAVLQARQDRANAEATLSRVIGSAELVTASAEELPEPASSTFDEDSLAALALRGPATTEARAQRDAARAAARSVWTDYLPSLSASYSRSGGGSGGDAIFGSNDLNYTGALRFSLSLPIFDRFAREGQVVGAAVSLDNAEAALRDAELTARETLTRSLGTVRNAKERERVQTASVAAAEEDLRAQQRRYERGESTLLDVLTSQTQLDQARQALIRARYDRRVGLAQLESLVGRDLATTNTAHP